MATEKNVNTGKSGKKQNKFASWFLGLPKWGKALLIGGTTAVVATGVTVPTVLVLTKKSGGGSSVTETEFKAAFDKLKAPGQDTEHDNRNFEIKIAIDVNLSGITEYEGKVQESGSIKYSNDLKHCTMLGKMPSMPTTNIEEKGCYFGEANEVVYSINWEEGTTPDPKNQRINICNPGYSEGAETLTNALSTATYDYKSLRFENGNYIGTINYTITMGESEPMSLPILSTVAFDNSKNIKTISLDIDTPVIIPSVGSMTAKGIGTFEISNYDNTTCSFTKDYFDIKELNLTSSITTGVVSLGKDFSKEKIIVVNSTKENLITKHAKITNDGETTYVMIKDVYSAGLKIGNSATRDLDLSATFTNPIRNKIIVLLDEGDGKGLDHYFKIENN